MAPPNSVTSAAPRKIDPTSLVQEGPELLSPDKIVVDPRWQDPTFRTQNLELFLALGALQDYFSGKITSEKFQKKLKAWTEGASYSDPQNQEFNQAVVDQIHAQLALFQSAQYATKAQEAKSLLPAATQQTQVIPTTPEPPPSAPPPPQPQKARPAYFSYGLEFYNDTFVSDVLLKEVLQVNADAVLTEKTDFTFKVPITFAGGPLKLMVRPYGGTFSSRAIPGTEVGETGSGYRLGADVGLSNPWGKNFEASGIGLEMTGISSHAGEAGGIEAPGPVTRLHLFRQKDISFNLGDKFQLGINYFLTNQETYFVLGGNEQLLENGGSDFSTAGNLFAANKFNMLGVNFRVFPNGVPVEGENEDEIKKGKFRPGEAWPKIGHVLVGSQINRNRRRGIPAFANNRVFLGTFEPLGAQSRSQYDALGIGLMLFSVQDGAMMAGNIADRSEILRRGTWTERGVMLALDGANLIANIAIASQAEDDPPIPQTVEQFAANPGSVTDFEGRAGQLNLKADLMELGLSGLDAAGAFGREYDENLLHYALTHGALVALGIPLVLFSAPISGVDCAPDGTFLFKCGFGTTANTQGQYFSSDTFDSGPGDIAQVERQYLLSSLGSALAGKGITGLIHAASGGGDKKSSEGGATPGRQTAYVPDIGVTVGSNGGMIHGKFNW